jgi:hypothetical protein
MLAFLRSPLGRWIAVSVFLPLIAVLLSRIGGAVQRHSGHPTRISKFLLAASRMANRRKGVAEDDPARPALTGAASTELAAGERPTGTTG